MSKTQQNLNGAKKMTVPGPVGMALATLHKKHENRRRCVQVHNRIVEFERELDVKSVRIG